MKERWGKSKGVSAFSFRISLGSRKQLKGSVAPKIIRGLLLYSM